MNKLQKVWRPISALIPQKLKQILRKSFPGFMRAYNKSIYGYNPRRLPHYDKKSDSLRIGKTVIPLQHIKTVENFIQFNAEYIDIIEPMIPNKQTNKQTNNTLKALIY
jgi:hypothetical protein